MRDSSRRSAESAATPLQRLIVVACCCAIATGTEHAHAAAGTPEAGGGWVALTYDYTHMQFHLDPNGDKLDLGSMDINAVTTEMEYGVTDRLAVFGSLPYIQRKYTGSYPHTVTKPDGTVVVSPIDDGSYHGSFQDLLVGTKYQTGIGQWMITPTITYGHPTHDYYIFSHAAIGTKQKSTTVGLQTGRSLPEPFDRFYVELDYAYSFMEKFQGTTANHSTGFIEVDYFATERLMLRTFAVGQKTYDGIEPADWAKDPKLYLHHEQIMRTDYIDAAIGALYVLNGRYTASLDVKHNIWGENVHQIKYDIGVGISRAF